MDNKEKVLYDDGVHKCIMFSFDDESHEDSFLSVNQYLIIHQDVGFLLDPGSEAIFDELCDAISKYIAIDKIKYIFFSHQDPDVSGSITQWAINTKAKFIMSRIWIRFMSHYGFMDMQRVLALKDHGAQLHFGEHGVKFLPAHFLHSPGNFSLYDPQSKILFSGDIGAAVVDSPTGYKKVTNFQEHQEYLYAFHKRYMGSNKLCRAWVSHIKKLELDIIAPQHGLIFEKGDVALFLNWFNELQCGSDFIKELY